jgi:hypothetical protein
VIVEGLRRLADFPAHEGGHVADDRRRWNSAEVRDVYLHLVRSATGPFWTMPATKLRARSPSASRPAT